MVNTRVYAVSEMPSRHDDYVHDIQYDFYGKRIATCSSDKHIKIWDRDEQGRWQTKPTYDWRKHTGSVWKLAWSHPVFGSLLASASSDKYVYVYQEPTLTGKERPPSEWKSIFTIADHRDAVMDIAFAPRQFGLRLATACRDGHLRIFDSDGTASGDHWEVAEDVEAGYPVKRDGRTTGHKDGPGAIIAVTCLSWNSSQFDRVQSLVVGCGDGSVRVWSYVEQTRRWEVAMELRPHGGEVHSVAWAPSMGRCGHLIASCGTQPKGTIHISRIKSQPSEVSFLLLQEQNLSVDGELKEIWKVAWNVTGTTLATSGDDGIVRLWKRNLNGDWESTEVQQAYGLLPNMF